MGCKKQFIEVMESAVENGYEITVCINVVDGGSFSFSFIPNDVHVFGDRMVILNDHDGGLEDTFEFEISDVEYDDFFHTFYCNGDTSTISIDF